MENEETEKELKDESENERKDESEKEVEEQSKVIEEEQEPSTITKIEEVQPTEDMTKEKKEEIPEEPVLTAGEKVAYRQTVQKSMIAQLSSLTFKLEDGLKDDYLRISKIDLGYEEPMEDLTQDELEKWEARTLLPEDPNGDPSRVEYSFCKREYIPLNKDTSEFMIYHLEGNHIRKDSTEALKQEERLHAEALWAERWAQMNHLEALRFEHSMKQTELPLSSMEGAEAKDRESVARERELSRKVSVALALKQTKLSATGTYYVPPKMLRNKINFNERGVQMYDILSRDASTQTVPASIATFSDLVTQGIIHDEYQKDFGEKEMEKERERQAKMIVTRSKEDKTIKKIIKAEDPIFKRIFESLRILERMLNQNTYDYIALDCEFYEDPSDKYRTDPIQGTLLPLWQFNYNEAKNLTVTDLVWNPAYYDLFGVTFGSFDFCDPCPSGYLGIFTLKNPSYPEYVKQFNSGAICLDFHPRKSYFVAVGLLNGGVIVQNIKNPISDTPYKSSVAKNHTNLVWSILWCDDFRERHLCFFSAGADGRICKWMLLETELFQTPIITIYLDNREPHIDKFPFRIRSMPTCMTFHPSNFEIFYIGGASGRIFKCNISYASTYLYYIEAHRSPIHRIAFNYYNVDIFATCSDDWRVKIWEDECPEPFFSFDLENPVLDVKWAPYSSTVFAAYVTTGRVFVYDLHIDKYEPLCKQTVICPEDNVGTRLSFNNRIPIIIVGDTRGNITTLKVSPNLRTKPKPKKGVVLNIEEWEQTKLKELLAEVREPFVLDSGDEDERKLREMEIEKEKEKGGYEDGEAVSLGKDEEEETGKQKGKREDEEQTKE